MNFKIFHSAFLLLLLVCNYSYSQNYINYTEKDGLAGNYVYRMTQDKEGFMWFLTDKGMSKFDGNSFKNFTTKDGLPANDNWHIRITPDNRVWYFSRSDELGYIHNDSVHKFKASDGKMMNPNGRIFQSDNDISFVDQSTVYQFSDSIWKSSPIHEHRIPLLNRDVFLVRNFPSLEERLEDKQGRLLLSLIDVPVYRNYYQLADSLFVKALDNKYEIINLNNFESYTGDISHLDKSEFRNSIFWFSLANDKLQLSGGKWLITFDSELAIKETFELPSPINTTYSFQDKDGFIWTTSNEMGVFKLPIDYGDITSFFEGKLIRGIDVIDDEIIIAVDGDGIYKWENNKPSLILKEKTRFYSWSRFENNIYYNFRFYLLNEKDGKFEKIERPDTYFGYNMLYYQGDYFTEGSSHIGKYDGNFEYSKGFIDHPYYQGLFKQNDTLFSFSYKQMLHYNEANDSFVAYKDVEIQKKLLCSKTIENRTYIGTEGDGLYLFENGKLSKLNSNDNTIVNKISLENENSIWAVSEGKLLHYYRNQTDQFSVKKHNQINGFPTSNLTEVFFYDGKLYLGSTNGLTIIDKEDISETSTFTPYIKNILVNGIKQYNDSITTVYDSHLNLKVNFGAINFYDSNNTEFQYKLEPLQEEWVTTVSGEVNLYGLPPNNYQLLLDTEHNNVHKTISIPISITPRWWQTYWLPVLSMITLVAIVIFVLYYLMRHFRRKLLQERELAQLQLRAIRSQMNPHFVFNSLSAIQYYINENNFETSEKYLVKFSKLIRQFFEMSSKEEINIKNEATLIKNYLDIEKLRFREKMDYSLHIDPLINDEHTFIPTMLLQPVVENAVNHGIFNKEDEGNITINFNYINKNEIAVEIKDDGVGFINAKKRKGKKKRSSMVLKDRLYFLNQSGRWQIDYITAEAFPLNEDKGNISTFTINKL